jgi:hypothetical protein
MVACYPIGMNKTMMSATALSILLFACGGNKKTVEVAEPVVAETCCCKWTPITSEDAKAKYAVDNRMECSSKQGECIDESQCTASVTETPAP